MIDKEKLFDTLDILNEVSMVHEVEVVPFFEEDYLPEFFDFYEIKNRNVKLIPSEEDLEGSLRDMCGEGRCEEIAELTKKLFGLPKRILMLSEEDVRALQDEMEGPDGLAPFYFVFDMLFCEYENFTLYFIFGTNN